MAEETFTPLYPEETEDAISARWAGWANEGVSPGDDDYVDTAVGSLWWVLTRPGIREAARQYDLLGTENVAAAFPQFAWGVYLDDHAEREGLDRNEATDAEGKALFTGPVATAIPAGQVVYVLPADASSDPIEFTTDSGGSIPAAAVAPTGAAVAMVVGGTLTNGTTYRYVITAVDDAGETTVSTEVSAAATSTNKTGSLSWGAVATARSYNVYRKDGGSTGPPYNFVANTISLTYLDTGAVVPDAAHHPPGANTTGGKLALPVTASETGAEGNVGATAVTGMSPPITGVTVTNPLPMFGGADTEGDEPLRVRVEGGFVGVGGANVAFYTKRALDYPGVGRVSVVPGWNGATSVLVVVTDANGLPVSQSIIDGLQAELDPVLGLGSGDAPVGATATVKTAAALAVTVGSTIEFEPGYSLDGAGGTIALRTLITTAVKGYVEAVPSGGEIVRARIVQMIAGVPGVHDVSVTITGAAGNGNLVVPASPPQVPVLTFNPAEGTL